MRGVLLLLFKFSFVSEEEVSLLLICYNSKVKYFIVFRKS